MNIDNKRIEDEVLNWDVHIKPIEHKVKGIIKVEIKYVGKSKPIPYELEDD